MAHAACSFKHVSCDFPSADQPFEERCSILQRHSHVLQLELILAAQRTHSKRAFASTHRLIGAYRMDLSPEHDGREDQKEETLKAEENEEDDGCWWGEVAALWKREQRISQSLQRSVNNAVF